MPINNVSLAHLPPELYIDLLSHVGSFEQQETALALSRALIRSPVPLRQLFEHVHLDSKDQVPKFWRRLRLSGTNPDENPENSWVRSFELKAWNPDADVLVKWV